MLVVCSLLTGIADGFGPRLSGSQNLENAIDWVSLCTTVYAQSAVDYCKNEIAWITQREKRTSASKPKKRRKKFQMVCLGTCLEKRKRNLNNDFTIC